MTPTLITIVEGHGEVKAVPVLIRRLAQECSSLDLRIPRPIRCPRSKIVRPDGVDERELARALELACLQLPSREHGAVLVLLDADDSCPKEVAERIEDLARRCRGDVAVGVVLAKWEYEAWLIAAIESLRGTRGIGEDASAPPDPEAEHDAKGYLTDRMVGNRRYSPTADQAALTERFDLDQAAACRSFRKLRSETRRLLEQIHGRRPRS